MLEQLNKAIGIMFLWIAGMIAIAFAVVWNVIPSVILVALVASPFAFITWALLLASISYKIHWLVWTILIYVSAFQWDKIVENKVYEEIDKNES